MIDARCSTCGPLDLEPRATWVNTWASVVEAHGRFELSSYSIADVMPCGLVTLLKCDRHARKLMGISTPVVNGSWIRTWLAPIYGKPVTVGSEQYIRMEIALRGGRTFDT